MHHLYSDGEGFLNRLHLSWFSGKRGYTLNFITKLNYLLFRYVQLQGPSPPPPNPSPCDLPLESSGCKTPDPHYRLALRARRIQTPFKLLDPPVCLLVFNLLAQQLLIVWLYNGTLTHTNQCVLTAGRETAAGDWGWPTKYLMLHNVTHFTVKHPRT